MRKCDFVGMENYENLGVSKNVRRKCKATFIVETTQSEDPLGKEEYNFETGFSSHTHRQKIETVRKK